MSEAVYGVPADEENETFVPDETDYSTPDLDLDELSPFDQLKAESQRDIDEPVVFDIPRRKGWQAVFSTIIEKRDLDRYERGAKGKRKEADPLIIAAMAVVEKTTELRINGKTVMTPDRENLIFSSEEFISLQGKNLNAHEALIRFTGDAGALSLGKALLEASGYGEDLTPLDPTEG